MVKRSMFRFEYLRNEVNKALGNDAYIQKGSGKRINIELTKIWLVKLCIYTKLENQK